MKTTDLPHGIPVLPGNLGGNALEAMQAFEMAMHVMGKYLSPLCRIRQRILETGDEDIVRVPCLAKLEISVEGDESGGKYIRRAAKGAALMTGCKAEFYSGE